MADSDSWTDNSKIFAAVKSAEYDANAGYEVYILTDTGNF
jgi:hypothetical protein